MRDLAELIQRQRIRPDGSPRYHTRHPRGERHWRATLTDEQVCEIRALYRRGKRGHGISTLAKQYGAGYSTVRDIVTYRTRASI